MLDELVAEHRTRSIMYVLQRLGEDQPRGRAAAGRHPWLAMRRQRFLDAPTPLGRPHAGQRPRVYGVFGMRRRQHDRPLDARRGEALEQVRGALEGRGGAALVVNISRRPSRAGRQCRAGGLTT